MADPRKGRPGGRTPSRGDGGAGGRLTSAPTVHAYRGPGGVLYTWCAHERRWHYHGAEAGHRVAHCVCLQSPYREFGYVLVEAGPFTAAVRRAHGRPLRVCGTCRGPKRSRQAEAEDDLLREIARLRHG
jgi:hypothetical protein